ncbi:MAG: DUF2865 domain-containing protein [Rhizobium sp.]|nr:DUF2865 domain-containing protein [Rhizobium sp.]
MFKSMRIAIPIALALAVNSAAAASELCDRLNSQLTALSETYSAPAKVRKYARAIAEQKLSIRELRHTMRETGCSGGSMFIIGGENVDECSELDEKMARMEANLAILNEKRLSLMTGREDDLQRRRLVAAIDDNRCNEQPTLASTDPVLNGADPLVSDMLDGRETIRVPQLDDGYGDRQFVDLGGSATQGSYRTMCVRTCDGGYFPISSNATSMSFQRDAQVCSMMCPGVRTELFYHSIRAESDSMRSAFTGRSYDQLENAYRYRTREAGSDKSCGCNFSFYYKEMMRREAYINDPEKRSAKQSSIVWIKPELRGQLDRDAVVSKRITEAALRDYAPDERVRQIGPKFLPDETVLDFSNPQPTGQN